MEMKAVFEKLWDEYININPSVNRIHMLLKQENEEIINGYLFNGFIAKSADKIFESTNYRRNS